MDLKSKIQYSKFEKSMNGILEKIDNYKTLIQPYVNADSQNLDMFTIILNEIYKDPQAFEIWFNQIESQQAMIESVHENSQYHPIFEELNIISNIYKHQQSDFKIMKSLISKKVEEKISDKLSRMGTQKTESIIDSIQKVSDDIYKFLLSQGFTSDDLYAISLELEEANEKMLTENKKATTLDPKQKEVIFKNIFDKVSKLKYTDNKVIDNFSAFEYSKLIEFLADSTVLIKQVESIKNDLTSTTKKNGPIFDKSVPTKNSRADFYLEHFKNYLYTCSNIEECMENRKLLFEVAQEKGLPAPLEVYAMYSAQQNNGGKSR